MPTLNAVSTMNAARFSLISHEEPQISLGCTHEMMARRQRMLVWTNKDIGSGGTVVFIN